MCKFCTLLNTIQSLLRESVRLSSAKYWREQLTTDVIFDVNPQMLTAIYRIGLQHRVTTVEIPKQFPNPSQGSCPQWDYLGGLVPKETFTHSHSSWSSDILYQLSPSTTIHSIFLVQFTYLAVLFHNLCPGPLWSCSCSGTPYFILHTFLHPIVIFFSQHMPIPLQTVLLKHENYVIYS